MTNRVMEILKFTESDLNYNRSGRLSPEQQTRVTRSRRRLKMVLLVIGLILLCIAGVWTLIFAQQAELSAAVIPIVLGAVFFWLPGLVALLLGVKPMTKITIERVQGAGRVARVEHTSTSSGGGTRRYVKTELHMGDRIFVVPDEAFSELEDGATYAVYCWQGANEIFSLEKL